MRYTANKVPAGTAPIEFRGAFNPARIPAPYDALNEASIADYPWLSLYPDSFPAFARVGWNEDGLFVLMYAKEAPIQSRETAFGGRQCQDSCMEFFFMPFPDVDANYLNVEINPAGIPHVGLGIGRRPPRRHFTEAIPGMTVHASAYEGEWWAISYVIPMRFIKEIFGRELTAGTIRGNFYKCSEDIHPHFGTWNPVSTEKPDFHRPECFGEIELEDA